MIKNTDERASVSSTGIKFNHVPVLLSECLEYLDIKPKGIYVDGTIGGAGHSSEIYKRLGAKGTLIGIDQDAFAIEISRKRLSETDGKANIILVNENFKQIKEICKQNNIDKVDGILLDLGVSSHQLDQPERGFSYKLEAPLDMRMNVSQKLTAEVILNEYSEEKIRNVIRDFGEEKWASRIAKFIVEARQTKKIETTWELVEIIKAAIPSAARREGPHPAKRTFQAIRIEVNNELGLLKQAVEDALSVLQDGGRLCVITFHSLEDRIVKNEFNSKANPCICPPKFPACICGRKAEFDHLTKKPILPTEKEIEQNPRSRSAKLRVIRKKTTEDIL